MTRNARSLNPFPGLRPFRANEDYLFFGREEQTLELLTRLASHRFVAVVGTSGSGKSSLVRCGLLSELQGGKMLKAGAAWEIAVAHPGGNPLALLTEALLEADLYDRQQEHVRENLLATLSRSHFGLVEAVKQAGLDEATNFLLVVDQFEEIFRFHEAGQSQQEVANEFVSLLLEAVAQTKTPIYVVLTMRSDFIGECGQFEGLAEMVNRGEFLIPRLSRDQYKRVIEGPIKVAGGQIAPRLLQRLLNDLGQQADQLPCLQHALMRTWTVWSERGDSEALDLDDYQRVGRMSEALSLHADEIYASLADDRQRELCRGIFQALTVQESENRGIRRPQRLGNLCQILDVSADELRPIIDAYRHHGVTFLTPSSEVELTDRTIIDISHESLMRVWNRLRHWVAEEAQAAGIYRRLSESAALYAQNKAGLYRDPELGIALAWREETRPNQAWAERYHAGFSGTMEFLEASRQAGLAEEQAREAARQRELEQAQQLAEARQQRLEQQQRASRRLRSMLAVLAGVAVIAGVACIFALVANNEANRLAQRAQRSAETATKAQKDTELALAKVAAKKAEVEGERNRAEINLEKAVIAERAALAAEQRSREFRYATDIQLAATLLADDRANAGQVLARLANHDPAANADLQGKDDLRGFEWHYLKRLLDSRAAIFTGVEKPVLGTALTADGELVILDEDAQLHSRDATTGLQTRPVLDLKKGRSIGAKALAPDGNRVGLAIGAEVHFVSTAGGEDILRLSNAPTGNGMIFSPDGRLLVTLDHQVIWWDATNGRPLASAESKLSNSGPLSISQDGLTLAVGGQGGGTSFSIFRMNAQTREVSILQDKLSANFGGTRAFVISPDGKSLAISQMFDGQLRIYDTTSGQPISRNGTEHSASVSAIVFSPSGDTMVTASLDGVIKIWKDFRSLQAADSALLGHTKEITRLVFADGGKTLLSSSLDNTTRIWDLTQETASLHEQVDGTGSTRGGFSPDGLLIATTERASGIRIKDASTGKTVRVIGERTDGLTVDSVAFAPDNRLLAAGFGGGKDISFVELWDLDLGQRLAIMPGTTDLPNFVTNETTGIVSGLAFSPDGKHLVASFGSLFQLAAGKTGNSPLAVYDVASRRLVRWLEGHKSFCTSVKFSADGSRLASGSYDGTAIVWDTKNWSLLHVLDNPDPPTDVGLQRVFDVAFSPAGDLLAMASYEGNVILWDVATGKHLRSLSGHANGVSCVGFAPDGRTLASGSFDYTIRLWSVATWQEVVRLAPSEVHFVPRALAFSPDGTRLLGAGGTSAFVWSTQPEDGRQAAPMAERLSLLLKSPADFQNRIRMLSENLRLHEALQLLQQQEPVDARIPMALAAAEANWHASRQDWPRAVEALDRLKELSPAEPEGWLRIPGLMRLATALLHQGRAAEAAGLLAGGAKRRAADGLEPASEGTGIGIVYSMTDGTVRITDLLAGYPGSRGGMRVDDVILKANDIELTEESLPKLREILSGKAGSTLRLTVKHARNAQPEVIELTHAEYVRDPATGELLVALRTAINEQLAKDPRNAGVLELRAELAGQWQGHKAQGADYSAAIEVLSESPDASAANDLARLYRRRAEVFGRLKRWKAALEDYAKVVAEGTTDDELLTSQALAQAGARLESRWLVRTSEGEEVTWRFQTSAPPTDWTKPEFDDSQWPEGPGAFGEPGAPGVVGRTPWTTSDIWLRRSFQWEPDQSLKSLALRVLHDDDVEVYLNGKKIADIPSHNRNYDWHPLAEDAVAELRPGKNVLAVHCHQYTGGQNVDVGIGDAAMSQWLVNLSAQDPWQSLALAYAIADDQPAIDQLVARRPQSAGPIGDVFVQGERKDWSRAVALYSQGITAEKSDVELLSRRARAYEELQDWKAAAADWTRAAEGNRDGAKLIAEFGQRLVKADQRELAAPQLQQARQLLEAALQQDPENMPAAQTLAQVLFDSGSSDWTALKPVAVTSRGGSTLTVLEDDSILASGVYPDKDVYEVETEVAAEGMTAIRLEVLTHDSFPRQGHGPNPNAILTEFEAEAAAPGDSSSWQAIKFARAWADHAQPGSRIDNAIDGQAATGWTTEGHNRQENRTAIFVANYPLGFDAGSRLRIRLRQESPEWKKHLLGRFRLAVTSRRVPAPAAISDLRLRLALAYAEADEPDRAAQWAASALNKAKTFESKAAICTHLQPFAEALTRLNKLRPMDAQLQLTLARHHAALGQFALDRKRPADALGDLKQARALFTRVAESPRPKWEVLRPTSLKSAGGATLTQQEDGSILAGGTNPDRDVYTFVTKTSLPRIVAIRLEALPDPSLPKNGPGRSANANFHLGEFRVFSHGTQATLTDMIVAHDELQAFRNAIDGRLDAKMGWSNEPKAGEKNAALFTTNIDTSAGGELKFEMYFSRGRFTQHNLGRFRLSVTGDAAAFSEDELHDNRIPGELTGVEVAIGKAYAESGQVTLAAAAVAKALALAKAREDRTKIIDQCSSLEETLAELVKTQPGDLELQLALARSFAQRGRASLSQNKPEALPALDHARQIFTRLLAEHAQVQWTVLEPADMKSAGGAELKLQSDGSILASGPNPSADVYTLTFSKLPPRISGLRLEVLPDESLPGRGPGRAFNGNLVLTEIQARLQPAKSRPEQVLPLQSAIATYEQNFDGFYPIAAAIDNDLSKSKGWALLPNLGQAHHAVFELKGAVETAAGSTLSISLVQNFSGHQIGRFRVSATADANAVQTTQLQRDLADSGLAELESALASAAARQGRSDDAAAGFGRAVDLATDLAAAAKVVEDASAHAGVLEKLAQQRTADARFHNAVARHYALHGDAALCQDATATARELYEQKLQAEPGNTLLAKELADLLLEVNPRQWTVLKPVQVKSQGGATLTVQPDGSVLASGTNPDQDSYTITTVANVDKIAAIRLEAMNDPSLPHGGPGRFPDNGNITLSEFRVSAQGVPVPLSNIAVTYSQHDGYLKIIDDQIDTSHWSIYPRSGKTHSLLVSTEIGGVMGKELTIELDCSRSPYGHHSLGRFRLSVSAEPQAVESERSRLEALQIDSPWPRLGAAYMSVGDKTKSAAAFAQALALAADDAAKTEVARLSAPFEDVFAGLAKQAPKWPFLRVGQAKYLGPKRMAENRFHEAVEVLSEAVEIAPDDLELLLWRADANAKLEQWPAAIADYDQVIQRQTDQGKRREAQRARAEVQLRLGRSAEGAEVYSQEMILFPSWESMRDGYSAQLLAGNRDVAKGAALRLYAQLASGDRDDYWSQWLVRATIGMPGLVTAQNRDRLLSAATKAGGEWTTPMTAAIHYRLGNLEQAEPLLSAAAGRPEFLCLAALLAHDRGETDKARQYLRQADDWFRQQRARDPSSHVPANQEWRDWGVRMALWREAVRNLASPRIAELDAVLAKEPQNAAALLERAQLLAAADLPEEALADLTRAGEPSAKSAEYLGLRGRIYAALNRSAEALADLNRAIEASSTDALVHAARGAVRLKQGDAPGARGDLERSLALAPSEQAAGSLADLLLAEAEKKISWTVAIPTEMKSAGGATLTLQKDGSVFADGKRPVKDIYTLEFADVSGPLQALRLEAVRDDRLPNGGPGTYPGGEFVLSDLTAFRPEEAGSAGPAQIPLRSATATFEERRARDSLSTGEFGWSIGGGTGRTQTAYFAVEPGESAPVSGRLRLVLEFSHEPSGGHPATLGRFRLSFSDDLHAFRQERDRLAALLMSSGWARLAVAYRLAGNQADCEQTIAQHPEALRSIAEAYLQVESFQQSLEYLEQAITADTKDADLLARRAEAHGQLRQWDQAKADWQRALELRPEEAGLKQRWLAALDAGEQWDEIAREYGRQIDALPEGRQSWTPRGQLIRTVIRRNDPVFERLLAQRPEDAMLRIHWARSYVVRSDWQNAIEQYAKAIELVALEEEGYEYAAVLLLAGKREEFDRFMKQFMERVGATDQSYLAYVLTRAVAVSPTPVAPPEKMKAWSELTLRDERRAWYLHAAGLAQLRAGNSEEALKLLEESAATTWHPELNQLGLALYYARHNDLDNARTYLERAEQWFANTKPVEGYYPVQDTDWLEAHLLLRETKSLLDQRGE